MQNICVGIMSQYEQMRERERERNSDYYRWTPNLSTDASGFALYLIHNSNHILSVLPIELRMQTPRVPFVKTRQNKFVYEIHLIKILGHRHDMNM